jgi:hypothetical protein
MLSTFGWISLCTTLLAVMSGLFQQQWRQALGIWLSAGFSLACSVLSFSGSASALSLIVGVSLGALVLSIAATSLEPYAVGVEAAQSKAVWVKAAIFMGAASGTGMVGFVSATGGVRWILSALQLSGGASALFLFVLFCFVLLGWKLAWTIKKLGDQSNASWLTILSLLICIAMSLGMVWTGSISGNLFLGLSDQLWASVFDSLFGPKSIEFLHPEEFWSASSLYWSVLILAFFCGFWLSGRKNDQWLIFSKYIPKTSGFLASGYRVDKLSEQGIHGISNFGKHVELVVDYKIWNQGIPKVLFIVTRWVSRLFNSVDQKISRRLESSLRIIVEVPAKLLQLVQTGDIQWYLFFALSSGFALLSHYLKL